jgi:hypothetical protein
MNLRRAVLTTAATCEYCGEPIVLEGSYWTHRDTDRVTCSPGSEQCAQPRSERRVS